MTTRIEITPEHPHELVIARHFTASRAQVWKCWAQPELLKQWYCPKPWRVTHAEQELRPGGRMNSVFEGPNGERHENKGMCLECVPMERLTFTDLLTEGFVPAQAGMMVGFVRLFDAPDGGTIMHWGARHRSAQDAENHLKMGFEAGWSAAAEQLGALATSLQGAQVGA